MDIFPPGFETDQNNIAIDFDGVIHNFDKGYHDGTCYGDPLPHSIDAIKQLSKVYKIIIFTAKAKPSRPLVNGKTSFIVDLNFILEYVSEITAEKPRAILYIDDNGYRHTNWVDTLKWIKNEIS